MATSIVASCLLLIAACFATCAEAEPIDTVQRLGSCGEPVQDSFGKTAPDLSANARLVASFEAVPSFTPAWGLRVIGSGDKFLLRAVDFKGTAWHSADVEIRPGKLSKELAATSRERTRDEVVVSAETANLLRDVLNVELGRVSPAGGGYGFDGTGYYFYADDKCGTVWSPNPGTRLSRLVDVFEALWMQASLPTPALQGFWERRAQSILLSFAGKPPMAAPEYPWFSGVGFVIAAVALLPLLIALLVMRLSARRLVRKTYLRWSCALSYGTTTILACLFLFGDLTDRHLSLLLAEGGFVNIGTAVVSVVLYWPLQFLVWVLILFVIPLMVRGRMTPKFSGSAPRNVNAA